MIFPQNSILKDLNCHFKSQSSEEKKNTISAEISAMHKNIKVTKKHNLSLLILQFFYVQFL